jgi:phage/conjugal plasmid C-4 type zinc finger TraR family protein
MADIVDNAQLVEELDRRLAMQKHEQRRATAAESAEFCECGVSIPAARRAAVPGCQRCVDCEELIETKARHRRGGAGR